MLETLSARSTLRTRTGLCCFNHPGASVVASPPAASRLAKDALRDDNTAEVFQRRIVPSQHPAAKNSASSTTASEVTGLGSGLVWIPSAERVQSNHEPAELRRAKTPIIATLLSSPVNTPWPLLSPNAKGRLTAASTRRSHLKAGFGGGGKRLESLVPRDTIHRGRPDSLAEAAVAAAAAAPSLALWLDAWRAAIETGLHAVARFTNVVRSMQVSFADRCERTMREPSRRAA